MKTPRAVILVATAVAALSFISPVDAGRNRGGGGGKNQQTASLSSQEAAYLTFMREEEKLARDVYFAMSDLWEVNIFSNIAISEQRHMDAILGLLVKYGLPDPVLGEGEFSNEELQDLYDQLTAQGEGSFLAALKAGALIEEVDIEDINLAIKATNKSDLIRVYTNLVNGSHNHLRAFAGQIEMITGEAYKAQYLPQDEVDAILTQ